MLGGWVGGWLLIEAEKKLNSLILKGSRHKVWLGKASGPMISLRLLVFSPRLTICWECSGLSRRLTSQVGKKIREAVLQRWVHCQWGLGLRESHSINHLGYRLGGKEACFKLRKISEAQRQHSVPNMKTARGWREWLTPSFPKLF